MPSNPSSDDFFAAPVVSNRMPPGTAAPASPSKLDMRHMLMGAAALVVVVGAAVVWWMPSNAPDAPVSEPPPQGGNLDCPGHAGQSALIGVWH